MKFRKKVIIVDAVQWFRGVYIEALEDCIDPWGEKVDHCRILHTIGGSPVTVSEGDWIITEENGDKHLCKPDIFAKNYETIR